MKYLKNLNEEQILPVTSIDGPVMVIAGAGSGKTRVLTYRITHLLNTGVSPFQILALTFTNKAAKEMKERIMKLANNNDSRNIWMGTFHSVFAKILRIESEKLNYPSNFTIYDTDDSKSLVKKIIKDYALNDKIYSPKIILSRISSAKSNLISVSEYGNNTEIMEQDNSSGRTKMAFVYKEYRNRCIKAAAMDFDDLLYNMNILLRDFPDVLLKYQNKFKHILVDEFQDTNYAQYLITKRLAERHQNICVVGDDAQSIYAFRGAKIENIFNFKKDFKTLKTFKLEQNYRSTKTIINAANSIIEQNQNQIPKKIWTENDEGNKIKILKASSDSEEGKMVVASIFENKSINQATNNAFTILYRTNAQSRAFEEALRKNGLPYRIFGGLSFYKRKEIKDTLAYFRLVVNNNDDEALTRIINYPARGIGKTTIDKITEFANHNNISFWKAISNLNNNSININHGTRKKITDFVHKITSFKNSIANQNAYDIAKEIILSSGISKELYSDKTPEGISKYENLEELLNGIKDFSELSDNSTGEIALRTLEDYMQDIALLTDSDKDDKNNDYISLMTIHSAKGLEFPYVYLVGLEENLFPSLQSVNSRVDLEEERRLFYVALTRAEKELVISYAESRYKWGNLSICEPSRFISEIDASCLDGFTDKLIPQEKPFSNDNNTFQNTFSQKKTFNRPKLKKISQSNTSEECADVKDITVGVEVSHQKFGKGKIISIDGAGPNKKATVFFNEIGQKQLLLRFAKLSILS